MNSALPRTRDGLAGATAGQIAAVPAALLGLTAAFRYVYGRAGIDLVVFDQGIWAASRTGRPWVSVIDESLLDHLGPGILAFSLLYRIVAPRSGCWSARRWRPGCRCG